ncbi:interferon lambda-3-like [Pelodiscus sinensis]|uniref:interferon lambda-3-like n=1 Tax=Pelodiscus sinensis TaxID=13735 RepID=UPI003F6AF2B2
MVWTMATEVFPQDAQKCNLSKYGNLPPTDLKAFKDFRDHFETSMPDRTCNTTVFHRKWEVKVLSVNDRVILVEEELNFTIHILENVEDATLSENLMRPLENLRHIREDLGNCTRQTPSHSHSKRLNSWLQNLQASKETETPACLEASVILNVFRLLNEDLRCAAYTELCV